MLLRRNRVVAPPLNPEMPPNPMDVPIPSKKRTDRPVLAENNPNSLTNKHVRAAARGAWSMEQMEEAIDAIEDGVLSIRKAATRFGIPQTTLRNHLYGVSQHKFGAIPRALTVEEEEQLAGWALKKASEEGKAVTLDLLRQRVKEMAIHRSTCFVNGLPGLKWWRGFKKRHPQITLRSTQCVELIRT